MKGLSTGGWDNRLSTKQESRSGQFSVERTKTPRKTSG
jgi:hypothetical protein